MLKYFVVFSFYFMVSKSLLEYGEFDLKVSKFESCKGPKRKNCVEIKAKVVDDVILEMDCDVKEDMKMIKAKIIGSMNDKELVRLQIRNLCDHIFFKPMIKSLFNNSDHCGIEKGRYHISVNIQTIARTFYGGKFIYGNWNFKWIFYNNYCNFQCNTMILSLTPKGTAVG